MKNKLHNRGYLIYARKSTDEPNNQKNSIAYQEGECSRYADNNHLKVTPLTIPEFSDDGIIRERHTAFKTDPVQISREGLVNYQIERPKFQSLITMLVDKEIAGVIVLCWDRICRNDQDAIVIKQLIAHGVDIRFVQTQYERTSSGALHMDIDDMFSRHYSRVISEKVKGTFGKLRTEGRCVYTSPIGYLDQGSDNKVLDPERAPMVKTIFEKYADGGWSINQLAKWANQQGLTTKPSRQHRTRKEMLAGEEVEYPQVARPVSRKTIEGMLSNPFYIGMLCAQGEWIPGMHPKLIDSQLFTKVQQVLKQRRVSVYYVDMPFFTYRGTIRCTCGRSYTPYEQKGINYYSSKCLEGCTNKKRNISESIINEAIQNILGQIHFTDEELAEIEKRMHQGIDTVAQKRNAELEALNNRRRTIYADLDYIKKNKTKDL